MNSDPGSSWPLTESVVDHDKRLSELTMTDSLYKEQSCAAEGDALSPNPSAASASGAALSPEQQDIRRLQDDWFQGEKEVDVSPAVSTEIFPLPPGKKEWGDRISLTSERDPTQTDTAMSSRTRLGYGPGSVSEESHEANNQGGPQITRFTDDSSSFGAPHSDGQPEAWGSGRSRDSVRPLSENFIDIMLKNEDGIDAYKVYNRSERGRDDE